MVPLAKYSCPLTDYYLRGIFKILFRVMLQNQAGNESMSIDDSQLNCYSQYAKTSLPFFS